MNRLILKHMASFVMLLLLQVFLFNHINLGGIVNPFIYVYFILLFSFEIPGWLFLISSFLLGLSIDFFSSTYGLHAAASGVMAFSRSFVFQWVRQERDLDATGNPIKELSMLRFVIYAFLLVMLHHIVFFLLESFKLSMLYQSLKNAFLSGIFSTVLVIILFLLIDRKRE